MSLILLTLRSCNTARSSVALKAPTKTTPNVLVHSLAVYSEPSILIHMIKWLQ
jgi:hypothetical protein